MGDDDWDLYAVVRGCRPAGSSATRDPFSSFPPATTIKAEEPVAGGEEAGFPDLYAVGTALPELEELCRPFVSVTQHHPQPIISPHRSNPSPPSSATPAAVSSAAPAAVSSAAPQRPRQQHRPPSQNSRSKRRKNQQKRVVCHVPADGASADMWAWRKYGQKPIKGSPYPRGYYRCSSSKGCPARKQVERSRADPGMLVITYTAEHNHPVPTHRNSLAGSTRNKFPSFSSVASGPTAENPSSSPPSSSTAVVMSPTTPLTASMDEEEEEGMLVVEDMEMMEEEDVLFVGLEEEFGVPTSRAADVGSDFFDDDGGFDERFFPPLWLTDNNAATAAGGS